MSIDQQYGRIIFACDVECGETFQADSFDFDGAIQELKAEGWHIRKHGTAWEHSCPGCSLPEQVQ